MDPPGFGSTAVLAEELLRIAVSNDTRGAFCWRRGELFVSNDKRGALLLRGGEDFLQPSPYFFWKLTAVKFTSPGQNFCSAGMQLVLLISKGEANFHD